VKSLNKEKNRTCDKCKKIVLCVYTEEKGIDRTDFWFKCPECGTTILEGYITNKKTVNDNELT